MRKLLLLILMSVSSCFCGENLWKSGVSDGAAAGRCWRKSAYGPFGRWLPDGGVSGRGGYSYTFARGWMRITGGDLIEVDSDGIYRLQIAMRNAVDEPLKIRMGFRSFDKDRKPIDIYHDAKDLTALFTVAENAAAGAQKLVLTAPLKYRFYAALALNAAKDGSDLPNRDVVELKYAPKLFSGAEVPLQKPLAKAIAAGTVVRLHPRKELILKDVSLSGDWQTCNLRTVRRNALRTNTKYIQVYLLTVFNKEQTVLISPPVIEKMGAVQNSGRK